MQNNIKCIMLGEKKYHLTICKIKVMYLFIMVCFNSFWNILLLSIAALQLRRKMNQKDETVSGHGGVVLELQLCDSASNFNLEKAVCSHGLFMMAPNHWDPHSKTLRRPLRLNLDDNHEISVTVHVSHPPHSPHALNLRVFGPNALSIQQQQSLLVIALLFYFHCVLFILFVRIYD